MPVQLSPGDSQLPDASRDSSLWHDGYTVTGEITDRKAARATVLI